MKNDTRPISDAAGEAAVWAFSGERLMADRSISPDDPAYAFARTDRVIDPVLLAEVREVDHALRSLAESESPGLADLSRARQRALETTRMFAADRLRHRPLQTRRRVSGTPRWAIAGAVAAAVAVGFVAWLSTDVPTPEVPVVARDLPGGSEGNDSSEWLPLMTAFNAIGSRDAAGSGSLDDIQTEVDALSGLTSVDN